MASQKTTTRRPVVFEIDLEVASAHGPVSPPAIDDAPLLTNELDELAIQTLGFSVRVRFDLDRLRLIEDALPRSLHTLSIGDQVAVPIEVAQSTLPANEMNVAREKLSMAVVLYEHMFYVNDAPADYPGSSSDARFRGVSAPNGSRDYLPPTSEEERIDLARLREIIAQVESTGGTSMTAVDLLNRLGIEDEELNLLKSVRRIATAGGQTLLVPGADGQREPGRRKARPKS